MAIHEIPDDLKRGSLYNEDLAPTPQEGRTWGALNIASLWVGMVVCIPTYMLAASMVQQGMSWKQAIFTVLMGNVIVLLPMVLNGVAGTTYGLSFPVLIRGSFGTVGTHVPSIMRALVACGWFGIQTWIGGAAIYQLVEAIRPQSLAALPAVFPAWVGLETGPAICFGIFWILNVYFIVRGTESIKWLETYAAPFLLVMGLVLLGWAWKAGGGFAKILPTSTKLQTWDAFWPVFWPNLTAMVGFWATLSLNIPDFTRYAKDQKAQLLGQAIGLPLPMALFAFIGVAVTGATVLVFGEAIWNPVDLLGRFHSPVVVVVSLFVLAVATLTTNIAANIVAPANSFSNVAPRWLGLRGGGVIAALLGIAIMPWKLLADASGYIFTWLVGYSALLGPIAGVMIADYFVVKRGRVRVDQLFRHDGVYGRVSWRALGCLVIAILPSLPGFLCTVALKETVTVTAGVEATLPSTGAKLALEPAPEAAAAILQVDGAGTALSTSTLPIAGRAFDVAYTAAADGKPARATLTEHPPEPTGLYGRLVRLYPYAWFVGFGVAFLLFSIVGARVPDEDGGAEGA